MGFQFSLATVLRFRESIEKREELALQRVLLEIARTRRAIEQQTQKIQAAHEACNQAMQQAISAIEIRSMLSEADAAMGRRNSLSESLDGLEQQRQLRMNAYQHAHRDCQMLTDLQATQREEYEQERGRADQKFLDDIFNARSQHT